MNWLSIPGLRFRGSFTLPTRTGEATLLAIRAVLIRHLAAERAENISSGQDEITFTGPAIFQWGGSLQLLRPVDSGRISFDCREHAVRVKYGVGYSRLFLVATVMATVGSLASSNPAPNMAHPNWFVFLFFFSVIFGLNLLLSIPRMHFFLPRSVLEGIQQADAREG